MNKNIDNFVFVAVEFLSDYKDDGYKSFPYDGDIFNKEDRHSIMKEINKKMKEVNPKLSIYKVEKSADGYLRLDWNYTL